MNEDTNEPTRQSSLNANEVIAERVRMQIGTFPRKFKELSEGGELSNTLRSSNPLSGEKIEQKPEIFTEQYLIEPILHGLGYWSPLSDQYKDNQDGYMESPHFVRQPTTYNKIEPLQPDYLLKNVDPSVVCIVEAKAANRELAKGNRQDATKDIKKYLEEDTFCKYLTDLNRRYLIGIGTDGFRWVLSVKDLQTGHVASEIMRVDLAPIIKSEALRIDAIDGKNPRRTQSLRDDLATEFVPAFAEHNILDYVKSKSDNK